MNEKNLRGKTVRAWWFERKSERESEMWRGKIRKSSDWEISQNRFIKYVL